MMLPNPNLKLFFSVTITLLIICGFYSQFTAALPTSSLSTTDGDSASSNIQATAFDDRLRRERRAPSQRAIKKRGFAPGFIVLIVMVSVAVVGGAAVCYFAR
ncbi:hypothetical protein N431DRAFT_442060 [Stipitochalara longipes BDJ]|nr:hypothetical protein N431DRAFT_442060 [Stipitochalara longipes BDJ]